MLPKLTLCLALLAIATPGFAQNLRRAVTAADVVVVAENVGVRPLRKNLVLHTLRVVETLHGTAPGSLTVVEVTGVSTHQRPQPAERRLYCLHAFDATKVDLPPSGAPYYKMNGAAGSNPVITDDSSELTFARTVLAAESGTALRQTASDLINLALRGSVAVRTEALQLLAERKMLQEALSAPQISDLTSRAIGETTDVPFKIALADLCAELRVPGLVDSLCMSVNAVDDEAFARALGRIARFLHGEQANDMLWPHLTKARNAKRRGHLLLAIGATSTEAALAALLQLRQSKGADAQIDAALRLHGSPQALRALEANAARDK